MKSTIVPAQITTVEDKVAGNLSLSQLLLLTAPLFIGSAIYIILPPNLGFSAYKIVLMVILGTVFSLLAVRIKGRILLLWVMVIAQYSLRPRYHIFDKNDSHLRDIEIEAKPREVLAENMATNKTKPVVIPRLGVADIVRLQEIMANPKANLHFKTDKKGALNVHITEVK